MGTAGLAWGIRMGERMEGPRLEEEEQSQILGRQEN